MQQFIAICLCIFVLFNTALANDKTNQFSLSSSAFPDGGAMPVLYTCDGQNVSPQITWKNPPAHTKSFAIIMSDPDAPSGTLYHWVLFNIPVTMPEVAQGVSPTKEMRVGKNDFGREQYNGPCPPKGSSHTYFITVYALDSNLSQKTGATAKEVLDGIQNHLIGESKLSAVYSRWLQ